MRDASAISNQRIAFGRRAGAAVRRAHRWMVILLAVMCVFPAGCSRLRLPAVDPTGRCLFSPLPTTTSIALPGSQGEGLLGKCRNKIGDPLNLCPGLPKPAFKEPSDPPKCLTPTTKVLPPKKPICAQPPEACVPSAPCGSDCKDGPPAILIGNERSVKDVCRLPKRGKRGCILLSPQKIVAPVGGEVILLSGICGTDGYLQVAEPLEWMLTPESVGTFIQVGDDDPGLLHKLARVKKADKRDPSYAKGVTSTKRMVITRGNKNPNDDVPLEKGQTWISLSSPSEGTSRVTVLAPESECWDQRKATATIYWVDARWTPPGTQIVPAGTPVTLTTRVTRAEGTLPARGWKVRYEIVQPELASFAGTNGSSVVEAVVDDSGNATAQLIPVPGTAGTTAVRMQVIRPGGATDNIPTLTIFEGQTFVTWSAPQLALRAGAPAVASFGQPFEAVANVSNPGDQAAQNVRVTLEFQGGVRASSRDEFATNLPNAIVWEIGTLPPKTQLDLFADVVTENSVRLPFVARADGELFAESIVAVDVFRPSLVISVSPERERYEVGEDVVFNIDVRNTGDQPLETVELAATGDNGFLHESNERSVRQSKPDGPLQPGGTWRAAVKFIPTDAGRRCVNFEAIASRGQQQAAQSCVTVINRPPPTPAVTATLSGKTQLSVGESGIFRGVVANTGSVPLDNVEVSMVYEPLVTPLGATEQYLTDAQSGQYLIKWVIPRLEPQTSETLETELRAIGTSPRSIVIMTVESAQGARDSKRVQFQIFPASITQPQPAPRAEPTLPPASAPPMIPPGPAPIQNPTQPSRPAPAPPRQPVEPQALGLELRGPTVPVIENQPINYTLRVTNPSSSSDSNVSVRFNLPAGVSIQRVTQTLSSISGRFQVNAGQVYLEDIRSMRPGETIEFKIVLVSNQPQTFDIQAEAVSREKPLKARSMVRTEVVPLP